MRTLVLSTLALLAFSSAACDGCDLFGTFDSEVHSYVALPTTLDALEPWAEAQGATLATLGTDEVAARARDCGNAKACFFVVPVMAILEALPPMARVAAVEDADGEYLYYGVFDLRGRLLRGRGLDAETGVFSELARLPLDALGEQPILRVSEMRPEADGTLGEPVPVPLYPQLDLGARYERALSRADDPSDRAALVIEQLEHLGPEGLASAQSRYAELDEVDDRELSAVMRAACQWSSGGPMILDVVLAKGGASSAYEAVRCAERGGLPAASMAGLVSQTLASACEHPNSAERLELAILLARQFPEAAAAKAEACTDPVRRDHLRFYARERPDDDSMARILRDDPVAEALVDALDPKDAADRRLMMAAIGDADVTLPIARRLNRGTTSAPTPDEFTSAVAAYAREGSPDVRHHLLAWLARDLPASGVQGLGPLRGAPGTTANNAALLLLARERERYPEILDGFDPSEVRWSAFRSPNDLFTEETLIAFALMESGCTRAELESAKRSQYRSDAPEPCAVWSEVDTR